jgi:hypothetical protein
MIGFAHAVLMAVCIALGWAVIYGAMRAADLAA